MSTPYDVDREALKSEWIYGRSILNINDDVCVRGRSGRVKEEGCQIPMVAAAVLLLYSTNLHCQLGDARGMVSLWTNRSSLDYIPTAFVYSVRVAAHVVWVPLV